MIMAILLAGFTASIVWFIVGGAVYMNPFVAQVYKEYETSPGLKIRGNTTSYLMTMFLLILVQCLLFAAVYAYIRPVFTGAVLANGLIYGLILTALKIIPRGLDMWIQTTYPNKLLGVEAINGVIGSFVIALVIAAFIK